MIILYDLIIFVEKKTSLSNKSNTFMYNNFFDGHIDLVLFNIDFFYLFSWEDNFLTDFILYQ